MGELHNGIQYATELAASAAIIAGVDRNAEGMSRLSETLSPSIDLWKIPEAYWLRREFLWVSSRTQQAAVAAELGAIAVANPPLTVQPGWLFTVSGAWVRAQTTQQAFSIGVSLRSTIAATLALTGSILARDTRSGLTPASLYLPLPFELYGGSDATAIDTQLEVSGSSVLGETTYFRTMPYVLRPGLGLFLQGSTVNLAFDGGFWGTARRALPGELDPRNAI